MTGEFKIGNRPIGPGRPAYIIAELSANHNRSFDEAVKLVRAAKDIGADAVKLQTYTADTLTIRCDRPEFRIGGGTLWDGKTLHDLYGEAYTPWDWQPRLKQVADEIGIHLFSTPFDPTAVDFLEAMDVPAYKIASFEMIDLPLIEKVARTGKPVIMSTGMATREEIDEAVAAVRRHGVDLALLKCTSAYPARPEDANLRTIVDLGQRYGVPAGLSDHTMGIAVPVAAIALGACIIEKHLTWSRSVPGPDAAFSLEIEEFRDLIAAVRVAERALGEVRYGTGEQEAASRVFRRSLFAVADIQAGQPFTEANVRSIRPGYGLPPKYLPAILGRFAPRDIPRGTPLSWDLLPETAVPRKAAG
ncbi:MAG: pseudaminic acid synthase [Planctomycetia bacterium]|nr:pseudaminic acid synthase [Planctomycetia bacterium]